MRTRTGFYERQYRKRERLLRALRRRHSRFEQLESRRLLIGSDWTNGLSALNVSNDPEGLVSPIDVLLIINELNGKKIHDPNSGALPRAQPGAEPPPYIDVNCDGRVSPIDALQVINHLNGLPDDVGMAFTTGDGQRGNFSSLGCAPVLREGTSFVTTLTAPLTIPADAAAVSFVIEGIEFDSTSQGSVHDAFEAALLDQSGRSLVRSIDVGRDAFFNATEDVDMLGTTQVVISGNRVTLSLAGVLAGTRADLVFRLVNNDPDTRSVVGVRSVEYLSTFSGGEGLRNSALNPSGTAPGAGLAKNTFDSGPRLPDPTPSPSTGAVLGRAPSTVLNSINKSALNSGGEEGSTVIDSRGKEFWIGFPDNLFEGNNRPQKVLYITGDIATTGFVDIPGLIDPATALPFHKDFIVNPGEVTAIELPSADVGDNVDDETDFDVEVEAISRVQRKGVHVVTTEPVNVYGLDLAVSTSDAFLALPVKSLGTEYINLGYENTFASIAHVEGTQLLVVATADNTQVTITPGQYTGSTTGSDARILRPNGTSTFNLGNTDGTDIGPFVTDAAGSWSVAVKPPVDGYSGNYKFEVLDIATAAVPATLGDKVTLNFPTGRESKVVSFDVVAGQRLYYDAINPSPAPNVTVRILSPSGGDQVGLSSQSDNNAVANLFGALQFRETGKYYVQITGEQNTAFDFSFSMIDVDAAPQIAIGADVIYANDSAGRASVYSVAGVAGQVLRYDALNDGRSVTFYLIGNGGQLVSQFSASDDSGIVFPETGTYVVVLDSPPFITASHGFRLLDVKAASILPLAVSTSISYGDGRTEAFRFSGSAAQTFYLNVQSVTNPFRPQYSVLDPAGNEVVLGRVGNTFSARLLTTGEYYLLVRSVNSGEVGDVTITPTLVSDPLVSKSGFNSNQTLTIAAGGSATYSFTAPAGTRALVDSLDAVNENLFVELNAPDGTRLFTGFGVASELQDIPRFDAAFLPQSGTYTITLRGNTVTDAGSYNFRVLDLDTFAVPLALNTVVNASFPTQRETLVYAFDATAGEQLLFDAQAGGYIFSIYDSQLIATWSRGVFGAASTAEADGISRILRSGRHYVVFHGDPSIPADFSFQLLNLQTAPSLTLGVEATGTIVNNNQVVYRVHLESGQRIRLDHLLPYDELNYVIFNSGGRTLYNSGFNGVDSGPPGNQLIVAAETGDYYVAVQSRRVAPQNFRFRIDDLAAAPQLGFDANLQVILNPGNAAHIFRIDATAGETIQLDNFASFLPLNWEITGPLSQYVGGSNDGSDFSAKILTTGTYYFTISGRQDSGPITINFRATRTAGPVIPLTGFNTVVNLDVGLSESKTYSFSAPTGRLVYLNVLNSRFAIPTQTVTLNEGETYLVRDLAGTNFRGAPDVTGSIISSTKPVAVFGGNRATFIPSDFFAADHLVEQLPPTNTWGREFVTLPLVTDSTRGDRFRFLAQADNTQVTVNGTVVATLNRGQFFEQSIVGPAHIQSSGPILVAQYAHSQNYYRTDPGGNPNFQGDPLMMIVPPFEQFLANYTVSTPVPSSILTAQRFDRNFINIVTPAEAVGLIELGGVPISADKFAPIGTSGFSGAQIAIQLGAYQLAGPLPFGVFVYGFGSFDSYGYVGGQSLSPVASVGSVVLTPATATPTINTAQTFTARVADNSGSPLAGIRVDFAIDGVNPRRDFGFSDANGQVQFSYIGTNLGRDVATASVGQLLDDSILDWRSGSSAPTIIVSAPLNGSSVPAGTTLLASGLASADFPFATLDLVTVNGQPIENIDAGGNFFVSLFVGPGDNEFEFTAIDSESRTVSQAITLTGTQRDPSQVDFTQFADVTGSFDVQYSRTSYNQSTHTVYAETAVKNSGQFQADVPLLVAIANLSDPRVLVRDAAGKTPEGLPYYDFTALVAGGTLAPQGETSLLAVAFFNPNQTQFTYDLVFLGRLNEPPRVTSVPTTSARAGRTYRYEVEAIDPNGDPLSYELLESPTAMTINAQTGLIQWTPTATEVGTQTILVQVSDPRGGVTTQRFTLRTESITSNRAPLFNFSPTTLAEVGMPLAFTATALDADDDPLIFSVISGPTGLTVNANGQVQWTPTAAQLGSHSIELQVSDGRGGRTRQAFTICVVSPFENHPPLFISSPPLSAAAGQFTYSARALDGDGEPLTYGLLTGPSGLTINSSSGVLSWLTTSGNLGSHLVTIAASDPRGGSDIQSFMLSILNNSPPTIGSQPILSTSLEATYSYQVLADDADNDLLAYRLIEAPAGMTVSSSGLITWTVPNTAFEQERGAVQVSDGLGGTVLQSFTIQVVGGQSLAQNAHPIFLSQPLKIAAVGQKYIYHPQARDPNGDVMSFDLPLAPTGMAIDSATGIVAWTPKADQTGSQTIVLRARDSQGAVWLQSFELQVAGVNAAPVITSSPVLTASVGNPWEYRLWVQDAENNPLMFELVSPPAGMTLTPLTNSDANAVLSFTPASAGNVVVRLRVTDSQGGQTEQQFTIQVVASSANVAPLISSTPRANIAAGQLWVYKLDASDPNADRLSFTISQSPTGMSFDADMRVLTWTPTLAQLGSHPVTILVGDGRGGIVEQSFTLEVTAEAVNNAPRIVSPPTAYSATVDEPFVYDLRALDADGDPLEWSLAAAPRGASIDPLRGTLRWTPGLDQLGPQRFTIAATDPSGRTALQSFSLVVSCANLPPTIASRAPAEATVDERYVYGVRAIDPEGDIVTFTLIAAPTGMTIDSQRGVIRWTPTSSQLGTVTVTLAATDARGNTATQSFDIDVSNVVRNAPPVISSRANFRARVNAAYDYQVIARDPEGDAITYSLLRSPSGMTIDANTGLIAWTPTITQAGAHLIQVQARDTAGNSAVQRFAILARVNQAPVITSTAPKSVSLGGVYRYDLAVNEPDGDAVSFALLVAPTGMTIDPHGRITWPTLPGVELANSVTVEVTDSFGAVATQTFTLSVTPDQTAPRIVMQLSTNPLALGEDVVVVVQATDDVGVVGIQLTMNGQPLVLDANHSITLRGATAGLFNLTATARDSSGNVGTAAVQLRVFDPADTQGPTITITSPTPNAMVTSLTDIVGSITDDNLQFYRIDYGRADQVDVNRPETNDADYRTLATSNTAAVDAVLASFDPTLLINDDYIIRVLAQDLSGNVSAKTLTLGISGQLKLGQFAFDIVDLSIPVAGATINVTRNYDTRNAGESGDFGYGWNLKLQDGQIRESIPVNPLEEQGLSFAANPFREGTRVYLTNAQGERVGFTFRPQQQFSIFGGGSFTATFVPDRGVTDRLDVGAPQLRRVNDAFYDAAFGNPFNPSAYRLTSRDGTVSEYDQFFGLVNRTDRTGNRLEFRSDGVFSSSSDSIQFVRDPQGRISRIIDPAGSVLSYEYDLNGDLIAFTDQVGQTTYYDYAGGEPRLLDTVIKPDGSRALAASFDESGRLKSSANAIGATVQNSFDLQTLRETSIDPLGLITTVQFDDRGNILRVDQPGGGMLQFVYDVNDNVTSATDEAGNNVQRTFDSQGNIVHTVDPLGNAYASTYNNFGQLTSVTDSLGRTSLFTYSARGELLKMVNAEGVVTEATYDDRGRTLSQTDAKGNKTSFSFVHTTRASSVVFPSTALPAGGGEPEETQPPSRRYEYNELGQVTRETDENGNATQNFYDSLGRPLRTVDATGAAYSYVWINDRLMSATDSLGRITRYEYDALGRRVKSIDPVGGITEIAYDAKNQVTQLKDPLGRVTSYVYTDDARLKEQRDALGNVTKYEYDAIGNRTAVVDALERRFEYVYDALGQLTKSTDPLGQSTRFEYDSAGNLTRITDARGHVTQYRYDNLNRPVEAIDALGNSTRREYDVNGNIIREIDANGNASFYEYDARDRLIRSTDAAGFTRSQVFDNVGNKVSYTDEMGEITRLTYDAANRGIGTINSLGGTTTRTLDAFGNVIRFQNELGNTISLDFNGLNQVTVVASSDGRTTRYAYDAAGNRTQVVDPLGNQTQLQYDALNRLVRETNALGDALQFRFDAVGNLISQIDRNGREIRYQYDANRQLLQEQWLNSESVVHTISTTRDEVGNITRLAEPNSVLDFQFDALNRVASQAVPLAGTTQRLVQQFEYNAVGLPTQISDNRGATLTRLYDHRNLLSSTALSTQTLSGIHADFEYDARGNRILVERFSGVNQTLSIANTTQTFDRLGNLQSVSHSDEGQNVLDRFTYAYDSLSRVKSETSLQNTANFQYDPAGQLISRDNSSLPDEAYQFDAAGNRSSAAIQTGANNQLLRDGQFDFAYDRQGNLITKSDRTSGELTAYKYDHRQRMTSVVTSTAQGAVLSEVTYAYDALNRRISVNNGSSLLYTSYLGEAPWADYDALGNVHSQYLPGAHLDELLARQRTTDGVAWYLADRLGSTRSIVDQSGAVQDRIAYDSFGNIISESNPTFGDRFKFTGREFDRETGLYYYRARYYDPVTGEFVNEDPLGFAADDTNLQRYVGNDPVNSTDPLGLQSIASFGSLLSFVQSYAAFATSYGADQPFTYRIACRQGACGISGAVDDSKSSVKVTGVPVPGSGGNLKVDVTLNQDPSKPPVVVKASLSLTPLSKVSIDSTGKASFSTSLPATPFGNSGISGSADSTGTTSVSGPGASFTSTKTSLPDNPNVPASSDFDFVVTSTAKSPHLLISGNIAIYVGVAQELELIAKAAASQNVASTVEVEYAKSVDNPSAAVRARGFARLPTYRLAPETSPEGPPPNSGGRRPTTQDPSGGGGGGGSSGGAGGGAGPGGGSGPPAGSSGGCSGVAIGDFVWYDDNHDGLQNPGELGVSGVRVRLFNPGVDGQIGSDDDVLIATTATDATGHYAMGSLTPSTYYVAFDLSTLPAGFVPTIRLAGSRSIDSDADRFGVTMLIALSSCQVDLTQDMGIVPA